MHDSLVLDFFKKKKLEETFHQSYSFSSSPTHLNSDQSHYMGPKRPPSQSNFSKALKHQNLLSKFCVNSFTHVCACVHIHTHTYHLCRSWRYLKTGSKSRNTSICRGTPKDSHLTGTPWVPTASPSSHASSDKMELEKGPNCLQTRSKAQKGKRYYTSLRAT